YCAIASNSSGTSFGSVLSFVAAPEATVSGTVTYANAAPGTKFISNATVASTSGSPVVSTTTAAPGGAAGQFTLTGFGSTAYNIAVTKTTGVNGISSFDAGKVAAHVAGTSPLTGAALVAAETSGNGSVSSFDAGQVAKYVVNPSACGGCGIAGQWRFFTSPSLGPTAIPSPYPTPPNPLVSRSYASVTSSITFENWIGVLYGETSGNWTNTGARPVNSEQLTVNSEESGPERGIAVELPYLFTQAGQEIVIPVTVAG